MIFFWQKSIHTVLGVVVNRVFVGGTRYGCEHHLEAGKADKHLSHILHKPEWDRLVAMEARLTNRLINLAHAQESASSLRDK
jgi:hypothetical protein